MDIKKLSTQYIGGTMSSSPEGATIKLHYSTPSAAEEAFTELTDAIDQAKRRPPAQEASPGARASKTPYELFAELLAEASTIIETLPPVVCAALQVRFALADELHGASLIAKAEANASAPETP